MVAKAKNVEPRVGSQVPRIMVVPDGTEHPRWDEIVEFVRDLKVELDEWQWLVLRAALMRLGDFWAAFTVAVCCPRQNGKNGILEVRELIGAALFAEPLVIHSAHLADTAKVGFRRLDNLIEANAWLSAMVKHIWRANGNEAVEFHNGGMIRFRTRTSSGGRGFAQGSPIMFDEAMIFAEAAHTSIFPVASASADPQLWYTGSAVDQQTMEDGLVFARIRQDALTGSDDRLAYFEWSLDYDDPDSVPAEVLDSEDAVVDTNPAYGRRITTAYIDAERRRLTRRGRAVERYGVGDWPDVSGVRTVIPLDLWDELGEDEIVAPLQPVFAFDVTPSRSHASIGVAVRRSDGKRIHVDVTDRGEGTGWVARRMVDLVAKWQPKAIVCDSVGPAASLVPELERAGLTVKQLTTGEYAQACAAFYDSAIQQRLSHPRHPALDDALRAATQRPLGERWAWDRRAKGDISPLVAVTLALGHLESAPSGPMVAWV